MSLLYADASALAGAYFQDERDHHLLRSLLREGEDAVATSELSRLELTSTVCAAQRAGRLRDAAGVLARFEADAGDEARILLISLRAPVILPAAHRLLLEHPLRTLDAVHLAVTLEEVVPRAQGEDVVFVTRDRAQAAAARSLGLTVR